MTNLKQQYLPDFLKGFADDLSFEEDFGISAVGADELEEEKTQKTAKDDATRADNTQLQEKLDSIISTLGDPVARKLHEEQRIEDTLKAHAEIVDSKLREVEKLILPLLIKLIKPESLAKKYIYWPNRKEVIERQIKRILAVTRTEGDEE